MNVTTKKPGNKSLLGSAPADAPETVVLANFVNKVAASAQKLKLFIDYHSYSQLFMTRMSSYHILGTNTFSKHFR